MLVALLAVGSGLFFRPSFADGAIPFDVPVVADVFELSVLDMVSLAVIEAVTPVAASG